MEVTVEDRLDVAHRLFDALCAQLPGQSVTLVDGCGRVVASSDRPNTPLKPQESYGVSGTP